MVRHWSEDNDEQAEHQDGAGSWPGAPGERLRSASPHGHWRTTTFVAGLRFSGFGAPMVIDGPINSETFLAYVRQLLVQTLRPNDTVIIAARRSGCDGSDNLDESDARGSGRREGVARP